MSATLTFLFGIWSGLVVGAVGFFLLRGFVNGRRERKLKELQRYREARGQKMGEVYGKKPPTLDDYLRATERDGI